MTLCDIMSSTKHPYDSQPLGWQVHEAAVKVLKGFDLRLGDMYVWVGEVIAEAKKTLAVEDIKMLPKTPSAKSRTRRCQRTLRSNAAVNNDIADISMEILPAKKTRKKASKASKKVNLFEDSLVLNETSRLEDVNEEEDARNENAKQRVSDQAAASKECAADSSSIEVKNADQGKENFNRAEYKASNELEVRQPLNSRDVLNMAAAVLDGNYKASSVLSSKTNPSNDYTPSSARKLFGYVKSALSSIVPSLTTAPSETSDDVKQSDKDNGSPEEKLAPLSLIPEQMKKLSASANQQINPPGVSSEMAEQKSQQPLAKREQSRRISNSKNGLRRNSTRLKVKRASTTKRNSKRLSIKASKRLLAATKNRKQSEVMDGDDVEMKNESIQVDMSSDDEIESTPPARTQAVKSKAQHTQGNKNSEVVNLGGTMPPPSTDALPVRATKSKAKETQQIVSPPTKKESQRVTKDDAKLVGVAVTDGLRCTRSKMRDLQSVSSSTVVTTPPNSSSSAAGTPSTATRSRGNKIKQLQELLCKDSGFGLKPGQTAAADDQPSNNARRRSSKRLKEAGSGNESRAKRHCHETDEISPNQATESASGSTQDLKNNAKGTYVSSCYPVLKRIPTPNNQRTTSFLQCNTPRVLNRQEMQEAAGRKTLAVKIKKMEELTQKKYEELQKKVEEQKRLREEHHSSVLKRRQELEQSIVKKGPSKLDESSSAMKTNDREKSKIGTLRERRLAEAEQRRKQEEEARKQALLQQEKEKEMLEEQKRRRKEQEEQERQQRIIEQRRQEEERRLRQERERQEEQERLRKLELQRLKEEEEKRKQKEERERKERAERERLELERQQKKEKQRQLELEKKKELERQKIAEEQARLEEEQRVLEEKRNLQKIIEKHNQTLKQQGGNAPASSSSNSIQKTQINASSSVTIVKCLTQSQPQPQQASVASAKPVLNTTFEKEGIAKATAHNNCDSYEMTPRVKKLKTTSTDSNYNIDDLNSEDSTDDESQPRKKIPLWAQGNQLKIALINQITNPPDVDKMFGHIASPDLNEVFTKKRARFNKRTSSANWDEPALPTKTNTL